MTTFPWVERYHPVKVKMKQLKEAARQKKKKSKVHKKIAANVMERDRAVRRKVLKLSIEELI